MHGSCSAGGMDETCAHHDCACAVPEGDRYCGDYCRESAQNSDVAEAFSMSVCRCNHLECLQATHNRNAEPGSHDASQGT